MVTSNARRTFSSSFALLALAPLLALSACAEPGSTSAGGGNIRFAISTTTAGAAIAPAVRVGDIRVLSKHVNLQEPVVMGASGGDMAMTADLSRHLALEFPPIPPNAAIRLTEILTERVTIANPLALAYSQIVSSEV